MNAFPYIDGCLHCEEVAVADLAAEYGTPLYVYSKNKVLTEFSRLRDAFAAADPVVCYSVKANGTLGILETINEAGGSFDIVSGGELHRVLAAGGDPQNVIFAGVGKTDEEIEAALEAGILMFDVESEPELDAIAAVARRRGEVAPVALRINPDVDAKTHAKTTTGVKGNKFGIDYERGVELADKVLGTDALNLTGIHMHIGSPVYTTAPYEDAAKKAAALVTAFREAGHETSWINLGGGFGLDYKPGQTPPIEEYAAAILPHVLGVSCRLALEPGRSIVGNAGVLLTELTYVKREGGKRFLIVDAAMNDLVRPAMYDAYHGVWPAASDVVPDDLSNADGFEAADVVGPVCESSDCFARDRPLPEMVRGELMAIFSAGAYGSTMASNYNARRRPAEIMVDGREVHLLRRRETYDDLIAHEQLMATPAR